MTYDQILERLEEIEAEYCPTTLAQKQANSERGDYDLCGCAICSLIRDLVIDEIAFGAGIKLRQPAPAAADASRPWLAE